MDIKELALKKHYEWRGKLSITSKVRVDSREALSTAYTPGVAEPCLVIKDDPEKSYELTGRQNTVAVITDGTAVLGLGDIGPLAGMPVMEGKCVLFREFAGIDAFPICIDSKDPDEIVNTVKLISKSFGGINLEDISAPRCFEIERRLKECCDIPVFHDDQHGTAVVVAAALINACKVMGREPSSLRTVLSGAGAAGTAICRLLLELGVSDIVMCDKFGAIYREAEGLSPAHAELAEMTNPRNVSGSLRDVIKGADLFIGVSAPNLVDGDMIRSMNSDPIVFSMANPVPEIMPEAAAAAGAAVVGSGRSDYPNQINNVLAFPGIFKGALAVRSRDITEGMKLAAAKALADFVTPEKLCAAHILPEAFEIGIADAIADAVAAEARAEGVARI